MMMGIGLARLGYFIMFWIVLRSWKMYTSDPNREICVEVSCPWEDLGRPVSHCLYAVRPDFRCNRHNITGISRSS
jgi:hypothetical protein